MDRIYLDHNATSPLAPAVLHWLAQGDLPWANPASQHSAGKRESHELDQYRQSLYRTFHLTPATHQLIYHSGVTEALNTAVLGLWLDPTMRSEVTLFVFSPLDHACVRAQAVRLKALGQPVVELLVNAQGDLLVEESIAAIDNARLLSGASRLLVNFTWVHNETGVVWPLELALEIKHRTHALIHVDAAQAVGKVERCWQLLAQLDAYSFSSHKCGGLKGHGWSFISQAWPGEGLILGGEQQQGLRAGTENVLAAGALKRSLDEIQAHWKPAGQGAVIQEMRQFMDEKLLGRGRRLATQARELNLNTIMFVTTLPSDMALPLFDLAGLGISAGAACSSGAAKPSHVLQALGWGEHARNGLRLSTSWAFDALSWNELRPRLAQVIEKLPKDPGVTAFS